MYYWCVHVLSCLYDLLILHYIIVCITGGWVLVVGSRVGGASTCQSVVTVGDHGQRAGYILGPLHTEGQRKPSELMRGKGPHPIILSLHTPGLRGRRGDTPTQKPGR